jgi:hypothetical protein
MSAVELALSERWRVERLQVLARVLEIALDAHRSEQEPPDPESWGGCRQAILDRASAARVGDDRTVGAPREWSRAPAGVADGESHAFIHASAQS